MDREMLFRGVRVDNGEIIIGGLLYSGDDCFIVERIMFKSDKNTCNVVETYRVHPKSIGQFTGLLDCEGVKIFEGDLILTPKGQYGYRWYGEDQTCIVKYMNGAFKLLNKRDNFEWELDSSSVRFKITGNQYQGRGDDEELNKTT